MFTKQRTSRSEISASSRPRGLLIFKLQGRCQMKQTGANLLPLRCCETMLVQYPFVKVAYGQTVACADDITIV